MAGLLLAAHGSHRNPDSAAPAFAHADGIRDRGLFAEVRETFWKEEPHFREALRTMASEEVYVVPLFVSEGYFTEEVLPRELRLEGWDPEAWDSDGLSATAATFTAADTGQTVHYCGPVGTHAAMTDVICQRAKSVTGDPDVGEGFGVAVVGHGTKRNANSAKAIRYHADRLRARNRFDQVEALFLDEEPAIDGIPGVFEPEDVVVVPLFVADGYHTREDIPADIGLIAEAGEAYDVPTVVDGQRVWYAGAVGTEPRTADVVVDRAREAGAAV